jgi:uracil-DNA glycosylase
MIDDPAFHLEQWQQHIRACRQCVTAGYLPTANPMLRGHAGQHRMLVGQAPGALGDRTRVPWSGQSGQLLRTWFAQVGLDPERFLDDWYITSLTKCFPGKAASGPGDRVPSAKERLLCRPWLEGEFGLVRPRVIVTLGRLAADALIPGARRQSLATLVGTFHEVDLGYGVIPIVPLPHPSGVGRWLNDPANRALVEHGLDHLASIERTMPHE